MWGSPGLLVIAATKLERTGEPRWSAARGAIAERLLGRRGASPRACGRRTSTARAARSSARRTDRPDRGGARTPQPGPSTPTPSRRPRSATARTRTGRRRSRKGWSPHGHDPHPVVPRSAGYRLLARHPPRRPLDELLLAGAELTWAAGPLRKGANLCHGTAGNGFAFLTLLARTGDERSLRRAPAFGTHAAAQVAAGRARVGHGRHSLWTGGPRHRPVPSAAHHGRIGTSGPGTLVKASAPSEHRSGEFSRVPAPLIANRGEDGVHLARATLVERPSPYLDGEPSRRAPRSSPAPTPSTRRSSAGRTSRA